MAIKKYYFMHPKTKKVLDIHNGRSLWEDHIDKVDFVVVREIGPSMEFYKEAMQSPENLLLDGVKNLYRSLIEKHERSEYNDPEYKADRVIMKELAALLDKAEPRG